MKFWVWGGGGGGFGNGSLGAFEAKTNLFGGFGVEGLVLSGGRAFRVYGSGFRVQGQPRNPWPEESI